MKPIDQTLLHDLENGQAGNCMTAFIASVLEMPIEQVPYFAEGWPDGQVFHQRVNDFLRGFNLAMLTVDCQAYFSAYGVVGVVHGLSGLSDRGVEHATVGIDGALAHDPHPSKTGLAKKRDEWGVFVVLDPAKPAGKFARGVE